MYSVDKSLFGMEELAGAVLQRCSVNKVLWKIAQILMKFQTFRPTTLFNNFKGVAKVFSFEFCKVLEHLEYLWKAASELVKYY